MQNIKAYTPMFSVHGEGVSEVAEVQNLGVIMDDYLNLRVMRLNVYVVISIG